MRRHLFNFHTLELICCKFKMPRTYFLLSFFFFFLFLQLGKYYMGFPGGWAVKNLPVNAGDMDSIPAWERSPEKQKATHSSISAWEDPWIEEGGGATAYWVAKALDTTQQLNDGNNENCINIKYVAAYLNGLHLLKHNFQFNLQCGNKSY